MNDYNRGLLSNVTCNVPYQQQRDIRGFFCINFGIKSSKTEFLSLFKEKVPLRENMINRLCIFRHFVRELSQERGFISVQNNDQACAQSISSKTERTEAACTVLFTFLACNLPLLPPPTSRVISVG